jgi:endonuclease/exonuclease/phosphatase family metal-dependent hydrolase
VPPGIATNAIDRHGKQHLTGVEEDAIHSKWRLRCKVMAAQLRDVGAQIVLHQELCDWKLRELLQEADCRLRPVCASWCCPISYDPSVLQPVYATRLMISSAPFTFLAPGACTCRFGQWVSACRCYDDDEWRAGGATFAAFRFVTSPAGHVDLVAVSVHLTNRDPAVRSQGAEEMLKPLVTSLAERYGAPVVVGGDFNLTKRQSASKTDKRASGSGWQPGAYGHLVGEHAANRRVLEKGGLDALLQAGSSSSYECSDADEDNDAPVCMDTWEVARASGRQNAVANGCIASTCHNWHGDSWGYIKVQVKTQGPGSNSIDVFNVDGTYTHTASLGPMSHAFGSTYGSARYIDWLLVDAGSLRQRRIRVNRATVHTKPGTTDPLVMARLPSAPYSGSGGYGSDHWPISVDLSL